jgi:UDP-glucose 4-epimerase
MKILVTGGAGYIGSHFVRRALSAGIAPVVYDNLSTGHRWALAEGVNFYEADLADRTTLLEVLRKEKIEAVVHFAANAYVGESIHEPKKYFNNNYVNTLALLDSMADASVKYFILSSTCAVYGIPAEVPIKEDTPKNPINPYGLTKHFIEETLKWYHLAYNLRYVSLRYFNAAGADPELKTGEVHEPETHLIPLVLMAAMGKKEHIEVFGSDYDTPDGTCVRDYIHVLDLSDAHIVALDFLRNGQGSGVFNLGNDRGYSVMEIIAAARKITGKDIPVITGRRREGDPPVLIADSSLSRKTLGWRPRHEDMETILSHAWEWLNEAAKRAYIK